VTSVVKHNTAKKAAAQYIPLRERVLSASFAITPAAYSPVTLRISRQRSGSIGVGGPTRQFCNLVLAADWNF
jgi:hypothetical protein